MSSKSTFSNSTSKSYALALYELAKENSEINKIEEEVNSLKTLIVSSPDFKKMILDPTITKEEKSKVIYELANKYSFCHTFKKFLNFLTIKNRLFFLNQIMENFLNYISSNKGELKTKLLSSKELSNQELENIQNELSKHVKSQIKIDYKHEPDLIAGVVIQVGSVMIDTSIRSKLKQLEKNMIEAKE